MTAPDLIDNLLPNASALRDQRAEAKSAAQASLDALLRPAHPGGLSLAERAAAALRTAMLHADVPLAATFRTALDQAGGPPPEGPRAHAVAVHVERLALHPDKARRPDIAGLLAAGLSARDVVSLSQLVALVAFQARLLAGLRLMEPAP